MPLNGSIGVPVALNLLVPKFNLSQSFLFLQIENTASSNILFASTRFSPSFFSIRAFMLPINSTARELKLSSFHLEFSFNSICYICLLFYCLVTFGFLWHKFCFKKIHWSDNSLLQVKSPNEKNFWSIILVDPKKVTNSGAFT